MDKKKLLSDIVNKSIDMYQSNTTTFNEDKLGFGDGNRILTHIRMDNIIIQKQIREQIDTESEEFINFVESVKDSGVISPVWVKPVNDNKYLLVAGERRYLAATKAKLLTIPAVILKKDANVLLYQIIENLQRKDLTNYEKAKAFYEFYCESVNNKNISPEQIVSGFDNNEVIENQADLSKLGITKQTFIRYIKLLCFNNETQEFIKKHEIPILIVNKLYPYRNSENIIELFELYLTYGEKALDNYIQKIKKQFTSSPKEKIIRYYSKVTNMKKTLKDILNINAYIRDKDKVISELKEMKNIIDSLIEFLQEKE
jgi:ParB family chromosome partitioning protein